jgi:S1-C subfamily serine protease
VPNIAPSTIGAGTQPVRLAEFVYGPQLGTRIGELQTGSWLTTCGKGQTAPLSRSLIPEPNTPVIHALFDRALKANSYDVSSGLTSPSYLVLGRIVNLNLVHCLREGTSPPQFSGSGSIVVEWEVMTATGRRGIYSTTTSGSVTVPTSDRRADGVAYIVLATFNEAFSRLASDAGFRDAVAQSVPAPSPGSVSSRTVIRPHAAMSGSITGNMKEILPAIVEIRSSKGLGSGFVIDSSGLIVTNAHVLGEDDTVKVRFDVSDIVQATVLKRDRVRDVALIKVERRAGLKSLALRGGKPTLTEKVYAIGSPLGFSQTVSEGIVSGYRPDTASGLDMIQATAPISPGNSGGPLVDASGNVIGIATKYATGGQNLNFFIPIDSALQFLDLRVAGR